MKTLALALVILLAAGAAAQTAKSPSSEKRDKTAAPQSAPAPAVDQAELDALKADLQRMNVTLNQMRSNLGFVTNTTGPLKHQFELDIDMWQMLLAQMERRVQRLEAQSRR
ncbi:MAG TPA: hypothetical protein VMS96_00640 [Terriglobales bacterium]|nr:hypothetical protein [Terriglobales bacterium]